MCCSKAKESRLVLNKGMTVLSSMPATDTLPIDEEMYLHFSFDASWTNGDNVVASNSEEVASKLVIQNANI